MPTEQLLAARLLQSEKASASATVRAAERVLLAMRRELEAEEAAVRQVQEGVEAMRRQLAEARARRGAAEEERGRLQAELSGVILSHERLHAEMDAARKGAQESVERRKATAQAVEAARVERAACEREAQRLVRVLAVTQDEVVAGDTLRLYLRSLLADTCHVHDRAQAAAAQAASPSKAAGKTPPRGSAAAATPPRGRAADAATSPRRGDGAAADPSAARVGMPCFDIDSVHHPEFRRHIAALQEQRQQALLQRAMHGEGLSPPAQPPHAAAQGRAAAPPLGEAGWLPKSMPTGRMPGGFPRARGAIGTRREQSPEGQLD